ncbi:uncharacterized protein LOC144712199 [Wolffia australiana]
MSSVKFLPDSSLSLRGEDMAVSNLESFLESVTPTAPFRFLPKWEMGQEKDCGFFVLEDLWDCYDEWSAYGVGAPIRVSAHETVVQYYTPFLSAMQIYTVKSPDLRNGVDELGLDSETESTSSENDGSRLSRTNSNSSNRTWDSDDSGTDPEADYRTRKLPGKLYFQYFEHSSPHQRLPFREMIKKLAEEYPGVNSLRSIDLSPASWMAVAWYPIYHLPAQRNARDLYSAFLTYHSLSSYPEATPEDGKKVACSLPPFGLASYRMQNWVWVRPGTQDSQRVSSLLNAAASWLTQVDAFHPDFSFFVSRSM